MGTAGLQPCFFLASPLPTASGNTHMATTANTPKPMTNQNRWPLPIDLSQ